jgi:hypothetical protein
VHRQGDETGDGRFSLWEDVSETHGPSTRTWAHRNTPAVRGERRSRAIPLSDVPHQTVGHGKIAAVGDEVCVAGMGPQYERQHVQHATMPTSVPTQVSTDKYVP